MQSNSWSSPLLLLQRTPAAGQQPPTSYGLREDEMCVAVDIVTHGLPALRLFGNHKAVDGSDVYELFADIFVILHVCDSACCLPATMRSNVRDQSKCQFTATGPSTPTAGRMRLGVLSFTPLNLMAQSFVPQEPRDAMEIFTVKAPALFEAMLDDVRLLSMAARLADKQTSQAAPQLSEVSRHFCTVLAAHLVGERLNLLQVCAHN